MDLSPEILKMRDALLERIGDKPLKDVAQIVNEILLNETNSINRLAALSARVKVLRDYINQNYDIKKNSNKKNKLDKSKLNIETDIKDSELNNTNEDEVNFYYKAGKVSTSNKKDIHNKIINQLYNKLKISPNKLIT